LELAGTSIPAWINRAANIGSVFTGGSLSPSLYSTPGTSSNLNSNPNSNPNPNSNANDNNELTQSYEKKEVKKPESNFYSMWRTGINSETRGPTTTSILKTPLDKKKELTEKQKKLLSSFQKAS
jgi:hypothetical protein